jgi:hypothetical protein
MTFHRFVRRLHLYLGLSLLPWFFLYGVSSIPFSHPEWLKPKDGAPDWTPRFDRSYDIPIPRDADERTIGRRIMQDAGLEGAFGIWHPNDREFHVYAFDFWDATQVKYFVEQKRLVAEDRRFRWDHIVTGMHARGGFQQESLLDDTWAVLVDLVCAGMILWIASGIYMWWKIRHTRWWGFAALCSGAVLFVLFVAGL